MLESAPLQDRQPVAWPRSRRRLLRPLLPVAFAAALAACGGQEAADEPGDTMSTGHVPDGSEDTVTDDPGAGTDATGSGDAAPSGLAARFGTIMVEIATGAGEVLELCLLHADVADERSQGLMGVTDLEGYDGMLFSNDAPVESQFVMIDTLVPLSISWWQGDGSFVSATDMAPCTEEDPDRCPRYPASGPYRYAIEVSRGALDDAGIDEGSRLTVHGESCGVTVTPRRDTGGVDVNLLSRRRYADPLLSVLPRLGAPASPDPQEGSRRHARL